MTHTLAGDLGYLHEMWGFAGMPESEDARWMKLALRVAMVSEGLSSPNPAVGAVLVQDGRCLATGSTEPVGGRHAERIVLDALPRGTVKGATLYVTLEPCAHTGRQPPCAEAIIEAGIARVVVGAEDTDARVCGKGLALLQEAGIAVDRMMVSEATAWHLPFLIAKKGARPFVAAKWAQTLDGQLAYNCGRPRAISAPEARTYTHWLRQRYDAILIGSGTALNDEPRLTVRSGRWPVHRHPVRVIVDPNDRMPGSRCWSGDLAGVLDETAPTVYLHGACRRPEGLPVHVVSLQIDRDRALPAQILDHLAAPDLAEAVGRPITSLLVEGGPRLHGLFLENGLVDVAHVLIAPVFGGGAAYRIAPAALPGGLYPFGSWSLGRDVLAEFVSKHIATFFDSSGILRLPKFFINPETALN